MPADDHSNGPEDDPSQTLQELFATVSRLDSSSQQRVREGLAQLIEATARSPKARLHKAIRARWLEQAESIIRSLRPAVVVDLNRDGRLPHLGGSRIGGIPALPAGTTWPLTSTGAPMAFVAQIALPELADQEGAARLPETGRLTLFCDHAPQALATSKPEHQLIFDTTEERHLEPLDWPEALDDADGVFVESGLLFDPGWAIPPGSLAPGLQAQVDQMLERGTGRIGGPVPAGVDGAQRGAGEPVLLLSLKTFDVVRVPGQNQSSFGQGRLVLWLSEEDLSRGAFDRARLHFEPRA